MDPTEEVPPFVTPVLRPTPSHRPRWAWLASLVVVGALVSVMGRIGLQTSRAVEAAYAAQDGAAAVMQDSFVSVPLLTDSEVAQLRRSVNRRHVALAETLGVGPPDTRSARDSLARGLVPLATTDTVAIAPATFSVAALTPDGAAALDSLASAFRAATRRAGLPGARFIVTSVFRSAEDQAGLRGVNANAAAGRSSHEYATTFDVTYRRYQSVPPDSVAVPEAVPGVLRAPVALVLRERWAGLLGGLVADYPSRYDALLGRALIGLEDRGVLVVVRERRQPVYHITVADRLAAPADAKPTLRRN